MKLDQLGSYIFSPERPQCRRPADGGDTNLTGQKRRAHSHFFSFSFTHAMTQVAPPPVLNFNLSGEEIRQLIKSIIAEERALNDEIAALKPEDQTFANVIPRIARFENANEGKTKSRREKEIRSEYGDLK